MLLRNIFSVPYRTYAVRVSQILTNIGYVLLCRLVAIESRNIYMKYLKHRCQVLFEQFNLKKQVRDMR